jgi:hypothetical protein
VNFFNISPFLKFVFPHQSSRWRADTHGDEQFVKHIALFRIHDDTPETY